MYCIYILQEGDDNNKKAVCIFHFYIIVDDDIPACKLRTRKCRYQYGA